MIFNIDYRKGEQRSNIHKQRIINKLRDSSAGSLQMRQHLETEESSMIHNHEVRSSILRPATRKHSKPLCFFRFWPMDRQGAATSFLGYHATGNKGLEGALRATETSCVPPLENQVLTKISQVLFSLTWESL